MLAVGHDDIRIRVVPAATAGGVPSQLAYVHRITEDVFNGPVLEGAAAVRLDAHGVEPPCDGVKTLTGNEAGEYLLHIYGLLWHRDQHIVEDGVPEGRRGLQLAAAVLFLHAALNVLGQVDGVILIHGLDHGLHDDAHFAVLDGLLDGDDLDLQLLAENGLIVHRVVTVACEAGELPQEDGVKGLGFGLGGGNEPAELVAPGDLAPGLRLVHENELVRDKVSVGRTPLAYLHQLGGGGELHLIIGGNANIGRGDFQISHARHLPARDR